MLDDEHRGYLLELMVTKLLLLQQDIQIIGMSATLSVCVISLLKPPLLTLLEHQTAGRMDERQIFHFNLSTGPD